MSFKMECDCENYIKSMKELDSAQAIAWVHGWRYNGEFFKYCPWCGKELKKVITEYK